MIHVEETTHVPVRKTEAVRMNHLSRRRFRGRERRYLVGWWLLFKCAGCNEDQALTVDVIDATRAGGIRKWTGHRARCRCGALTELDVFEQEQR